MSMRLVRIGTEDNWALVLADPSAASNLASVLALSDDRNLTGLYALLTQNVPLLLAADGNVDQQRSAPGTTGIPSVVTEGTKVTYSNGIDEFTPAASATDFWALVGSATKTARLLRLAVSGMATAADSRDLLLIKRSTANTGGTPTDPAIVVHDSNDGVATAIVRHYGANPTLGATAAGFGTAGTRRLNLGAPGAAGTVEWDWTRRNDKAPILRGVAQMLCLNWDAKTVPAGTVLAVEATWTEE